MQTQEYKLAGIHSQIHTVRKEISGIYFGQTRNHDILSSIMIESTKNSKRRPFYIPSQNKFKILAITRLYSIAIANSPSAIYFHF